MKRNMFKKILITAMVLLITVSLSANGKQEYDQSSGSLKLGWRAPDSLDDVYSKYQAQLKSPLSIVTALSLKYPNSPVTKIMLEIENDSLIYQAEMLDGSEFIFDAATGDLLNEDKVIIGSIPIPEESADSPESDDSILIQSLLDVTALVDLQTVLTGVQDQKRDQNILGAELTEKDEYLVYQVRLTGKTELYIDAGTGIILGESTIAGDDEEDDEDDR